MAGMGHKSYVQFGKETTFGAGATPTVKLELVSWSVPPQVGSIPDDSLYDGQSRRGNYQGPLWYRGTFVVRTNYEGLLELYRAVSGTYSNTTVESGVRDHTFKEGSTLASYEFQACMGDVPTGRVFQYRGAKVLSVTLRVNAAAGSEGMMHAEFTVWSATCSSNVVPTGSATFPSLLPVLFHQATVVDNGTADSNQRVRSLEVTLENPHTEGERLYIGSLTPDEPLRQDFLKCTWKLQQEFSTATEWEAAKAFTAGSPRFVFQHPTTIGAASKRELEVRSGTANLLEYSPAVEGYGVLLSTSSWDATRDGTDASALVIRVRSTEAALS